MAAGRIAAPRRWRAAAVLAVLAVTAVAGGLLAATPVQYQASGSAVITPPAAPRGWPALSYGTSEMAVAGMASMVVMSPQGQRQVRPPAAARFDVAPVNLASLQYPDFRDPDVTVTVTGSSAAMAQAIFGRVVRVLGQDLSAIQARAGAPASERMTARLVSGVLVRPDRGSGARMFAGLALLALLAAWSVAVLAGRRGRRGLARLPRLVPSPRQDVP